MSLDEDVQLVADYCAAATPPHVADRARVEYAVRGKTVTIIEASRMGAERDEDWLRVPAARMKAGADGLWTLYCFDRNSRAVRYDRWNPEFDQPATMTVILAEIEADPTCIFWG